MSKRTLDGGYSSRVESRSLVVCGAAAIVVAAACWLMAADIAAERPWVFGVELATLGLALLATGTAAVAAVTAAAAAIRRLSRRE